MNYSIAYHPWETFNTTSTWSQELVFLTFHIIGLVCKKEIFKENDQEAAEKGIHRRWVHV